MEEKKLINFKNSWKALVAVVGAFGTLLGIYSYFEDKEPEIEFQILSNSNVIDLNTDLSKLDIIYDKASLKSLHLNLRIINIRVENTGTVDILRGFYDPNEPLGLMIINGQIIERPDLVNYSSSYLFKYARPKVLNNTLIFSDFIIEKSEYFTIKLLILHPNNKEPVIKPIGKIAGIKEIPVINLSLSRSEKSFWTESFEGNIYVQAIRFLAYGVILIGFVIIIVLLVSQLQKYILLLIKRRRISQFKNSTKSYVHHVENDHVFQLYLSHHKIYLPSLQRFLKSEKSLNNTFNNFLRADNKATFSLLRGHNGMIKFLSEKNLIHFNDKNKVEINSHFINTLDSFLAFLDKKKKA